MSVQSTTSKVSYSGNNSNAVAYPVPFYFQNASDLVVLLTDANGLRTVLTQGTNYSVSGAGNNSGGSITTSTAYAASNTLTIYREVEPTQLTSYAENDAFPASSHERALDKLTFLCQQLARKVKLSFRLTEDSADAPAIAPGPAGYVLQSNGPGLAPSFEQPATVSIQNGSVTPPKLSTGGPSWDTDGNLSANSFVGPAASFSNNPTFRNRIINGAMRIDQRNNGAAVTVNAGSAPYTLDRFIVNSVGASITSQRVVSGLAEFPLALRVTGSSGSTFVDVVQRIEAANCYDLVGKSVTVSFTAAHSGSGTVTVGIYYPNALDNHSTATTIASVGQVLTSTLARYVITFSALPSGVNNGLAISFTSASGLGSGVTLTITGVQLEAGAVATPFEHRSQMQELALCQRYFQIFGVGHALGPVGGNVQFSGFLPVQMRATPTVNSPTGTALSMTPSAYTVSVPSNGTAGAASLSAEL